MRPSRRRPIAPVFGEGAGSNVAEYLGLAERVSEAEQYLGSGERIAHIRVKEIDPSPYQTRVDFDEGELSALGQDIGENGLSQPVTLRRKTDGRYELVAGERRWRAAQVIGLETVEARIRDLDDFAAHLVGVSENNQRADLSPFERALEALELQRHAEATGRPHAQRDLARYLNRNVAVVNQQLAIASAITVDVIERAKMSACEVCRLPHEALLRVAKRPPTERARALQNVVAKQHPRKGSRGLDGDSTSQNGGAPSAMQGADGNDASGSDAVDRWRRLWERGGFQVYIRKPFQALDPARARRYLQDLLPGIGALAERAAQGHGQSPIVHFEHERGFLLFTPALDRLEPGERRAAREALARMIDYLDSASDPVS